MNTSEYIYPTPVTVSQNCSWRIWDTSLWNQSKERITILKRDFRFFLPPSCQIRTYTHCAHQVPFSDVYRRFCLSRRHGYQRYVPRELLSISLGDFYSLASRFYKIIFAKTLDRGKTGLAPSCVVSFSVFRRCFKASSTRFRFHHGSRLLWLRKRYLVLLFDKNIHFPMRNERCGLNSIYIIFGDNATNAFGQGQLTNRPALTTTWGIRLATRQPP